MYKHIKLLRGGSDRYHGPQRRVVSKSCYQRCRSVFNIGGYNSGFRNFGGGGGVYSGFADFSRFNDY